MHINPALAATEAAPVVEAKKWIEGRVFPAERPLINVFQAAPVASPPEALRRVIADAALNLPEAHLYGPVLGLGPLREELAAQWSQAYGGQIAAKNVAITQGCNQAFAATMATLAGAGDEVLIPSPWYFNHKMWLDMSGVRTVPVPCGEDLIPDIDAARDLITDKTRAIALVSPNNPTGVEYPADVIRGFYDLAKSSGIALVLDETYRDFDSRDDSPHDLFADPDWDATLIHLYSFSKAFRLTGHRVGALITSPERMLEVEKFLDTVAICPAQLGQYAALWGLQNLGDWVAGERDEILARRHAMGEVIADIDGWRVRGLGAYFAYVEHPGGQAGDVARRLIDDAHVLCLPGTFFAPKGDPLGEGCLRFAFANIDRDGITELGHRLAGLAP